MQQPDRRVVLWPDTFNNYFQPDVAQAALEVLEHAGFEVAVPAQPVCCGRPLYDFGMLDRAKRYLLRVIRVLRKEILWGVPILVLEPSCAAVFRDELKNLLPDNEEAQRLSKQTFLLSEWLDKHAPHLSLPELRPKPKAVVHGHCHQKALMGMDSEIAMLHKMGIETQLLDSGCCGMAGSFGFEKDKYDVSVKCGEHALLPQVRNASSEALIVADGFSCQEQIAQLTNRRALHLAQVMSMALKKQDAFSDHARPEAAIIRQREAAVRRSMRRAGAGAGMLIALGVGGLIWASHANRR